MSDIRPVVVKVGGSLFDLPDLGRRLGHWLDDSGLVQVLLVPGGGPLADAVRTLDRWQNLGDEASHWLALETMTVSASLLTRILSGGVVVQDLAECPQCWAKKQTPILDVLPFMCGDACKPGGLPHSWDVTSDSIAMRVALACRARSLILLKSTEFPQGIDWAEASRRGLVDKHFSRVVTDSGIEVQVVNLRTWQPQPARQEP